jgi:excisionase family DNA binding protein
MAKMRRGSEPVEITRESDRLQCVAEAAQRLAVSSLTVRRLMKAGQIKVVHIGRRTLVPSSEIARIIATGCGTHAGAQMHAEG